MSRPGATTGVSREEVIARTYGCSVAELLRRWYVEDRLTAGEIAAKLGVSVNWVRRRLRQHRLRVRDQALEQVARVAFDLPSTLPVATVQRIRAVVSDMSSQERAVVLRQLQGYLERPGHPTAALAAFLHGQEGRARSGRRSERRRG
ncbi:MAG: hypothetical protein IRY95_08155 [Clostridia bacterium]|nr:hypothetical protein [Clostridia bacterium]